MAHSSMKHILRILFNMYIQYTHTSIRAFHLMLSHVISCYLLSSHVPHVTLSYIMSCNLNYVMLCYVRSCHAMSFSRISFYLMLCYVIGWNLFQCNVYVYMYVHVYTLGWQSCRCPKIIGPDNPTC